MDTMTCIKTRRSIRQFSAREVEQSVLRAAVDAARFAPSWKNTQTARHLAVYDPALKETIAAECVMGFAGNQRNIRSAPVLVVLTSVDRRSGYERDGSFSTSKGTHWQSFDAGIAAQTFCLAAHELGLGTLIMGIYDEDKVKQTLDIPAEQSVSALIAVGYYDAEVPAPPRKDTDTLLSFR